MTDMGRLLQAVDSLVDNRVGIIARVEEVPRQAGAPALFYFFANACDTSAFCGQRNFGETGGASVDRCVAMAKAIGEAVERYCSAIFEADDFPLESYYSAPFQCVTPSDFALYTEEQCKQADFPFVHFTHDSVVRWVPMTDINTNLTWHVPAALVYVPYVYDVERGEQKIAQPISTGLACHMSPAQAAVSAVCEVIERDAFTITWQSMSSPPQLELDSLSARARDLVERLTRTGSTVTLLNITMDVGVPTVLSVLQSSSPEAPAVVFAASSHLEPDVAVCKSLEEVAYTSLLARHLKSSLPALTLAPAYANIVDQDSHVQWYTDHHNAHLANFLLASDERQDVTALPNLATGDSKEDLAVLVDKMHTVGHRVLLADITTSDVADLGFTVVRAVIPGFHPLVLGHKIRALGGRRLWEVPQKLGHQGITQECGDNPAPHPYP